MSDRQEIVRRVKKLLNHADSAKELGSKEEATAFAGKAEELMAEYKISMTEVEWAELDENDPIVRIEVDPAEMDGVKECKQRRGWEERLAGIVARAHDCQQIVSTGSNFRWFVGRETDVQVAKYVFARLCAFAQEQAHLDYGRMYRKAQRNDEEFDGKGFHTSWRMAFASEVSRRYREQQKERRERLEEEGKSTALTHKRNELKKVRKWMDKKLSLRSTRGTKQRATNPSGIQRGAEAGREISLSGNGIDEAGDRRLEP